ncbi:hypothetical protein NDU88_001410 [Pleurodeles waltl]|uniref:Uncharacterized protein n=1 Tax=Pleurodeles waltl TaxID=8319 RepID=A0AAV7U7H6_PLEWA|nr:hypothetical protein NDU88_001410 [Pleurodeles waltl]
MLPCSGPPTLTDYGAATDIAAAIAVCLGPPLRKVTPKCNPAVVTLLRLVYRLKDSRQPQVERMCLVGSVRLKWAYIIRKLGSFLSWLSSGATALENSSSAAASSAVGFCEFLQRWLKDFNLLLLLQILLEGDEDEIALEEQELE